MLRTGAEGGEPNTHSVLAGPTGSIPQGDDGASSDPHALRVDHRRAQESCNGAIYC